MDEAYSKDWAQTTLLGVEVIEVTIKLGMIPARDHVQAWIEVKDPTTDVLLAQASIPHRKVENLEHTLVWIVEKARKMIEESTSPF